jgi:serine/threonine-protein kinase
VVGWNLSQGTRPSVTVRIRIRFDIAFSSRFAPRPIAMPSDPVEQNLLFALVAVKMGLVDGEGLIAALNAWSGAKPRPIGRVLVEHAALPEARLPLVEATYRGLLEVADNDPRLGLASLQRDAGAIEVDLGRVADAEVRSALMRIGVPTPRADANLLATVFDGRDCRTDPRVHTANLCATQFAPELSPPGAQAEAGSDARSPRMATAVMDQEATPVVTQDHAATQPGPNAATSDGPSPAPVPAATLDALATRIEEDPGMAPTAYHTPAGEADRDVHAPPAAETRAPIRYRALKLHAKGGLGEVFEALDEELGRKVALKEIQNRHAGRADSRSRFLIEAEVTGGLEHPGIVPVYGLGKHPDGRPYYAMRFIRGKTLKEAIETHHTTAKSSRDPAERSLSLRALLNQLIDVCNAMAYAHQRGILHRDIKPANIMLGGFGETLVVDWGLAKPVDQPETLIDRSLEPLRPLSAGQSGTGTLYGATVGTPQFMSPEQAEGDLDRLGPASDVYSIGATLYCILIGKPPFQDSHIPQLLEKVRRGKFRRPREVDPQVPPPLEAICLKAMAMEPEDRYAAATQMADDLEHWLADEPVSVYRDPWTARLARWARRHKTLVTTSAALVLAALLALSVGTVLIKREQARTEANFRLARDAVDQMLTRLGEVELADVPQMEVVRRTMLAKALDFYRTFLAQRGDDPSIRRETGRANLRLGDIEEMLGDYPAAESAYGRSTALLEALAAEHPGDADVRHDLADARHRQGVLLKKSNRFAEAERSLSAARRLRAQLVAEHPGDPDAARDETDSVYQLGTVMARLGRVKAVSAAYAAAVDAERKLAAEHPERPDYTRKLGRYLNNRGILLRGTSADPREAEASFREALGFQQPLAERSPTVAGLQWELARTTGNLAASLERTQGMARAVPVYREALARIRRLADDYPSVPDYQNELAVVSFNLGLALTQLATAEKGAGEDQAIVDQTAKEAEGCLEESIAIYRQLVQPERFPERPDFRQRLAQAACRRGILLFNSGRPERAEALFLESMRTLEDLVRRYPQVPEYQSDLGVAYQNLAITQIDARPDDARRSFERALTHQRTALRIDPRNPYFVQYVLQVYLGLKDAFEALRDHAAAAAAAEDVVRLLPEDALATYRSALLLDLSATLVESARALPEARRKELAGARAELALKRLRKAVNDGARLSPADPFEAIRQHDPEALERLRKTAQANANPAVG